MILAKIEKDGLLDMRHCLVQEGAKITELRNAGFLDFVEAEQPKCDTGFVAVESLEVVNGKMVQSWKVEVDTLNA